ncbi:MAG: hypothetical protein F4Z31_04435 [Gemmatimonadetes bacterium]|nr:hypothetical protein [Gemmatimonadota bacterium]MYJ10494.1 hypothetical protein [Gemmatimonadota bacterium]
MRVFIGALFIAALAVIAASFAIADGTWIVQTDQQGGRYTLGAVGDTGQKPVTLQLSETGATALAENLNQIYGDGEWTARRDQALLGQSCESRCNHKCPTAEKAQCVANCLSGYGPRCTPVPGVGGFHWPTCHDSWPDCVPPFAATPPAHCDCPVCCKYWYNPTVYLHCVTVHCGGPESE